MARLSSRDCSHRPLGGAPNPPRRTGPPRLAALSLGGVGRRHRRRPSPCQLPRALDTARAARAPLAKSSARTLLTRRPPWGKEGVEQGIVSPTPVLGAEDRPVGVVVKDGEGRTPAHRHGESRRQAQADRGAKGLRPPLPRPERPLRPVEAARQRFHRPAARQKGVLVRADADQRARLYCARPAAPAATARGLNFWEPEPGSRRSIHVTGHHPARAEPGRNGHVIFHARHRQGRAHSASPSGAVHSGVSQGGPES